MNTYSKALRHISMTDVKQKHQQKLIEQKIEEQKKKEEEKYIASVMEEKKYDWRIEIEKIIDEVEEQTDVDNFLNYEYDWREKVLQDKQKYFEEGMTSAETFFTKLEATGDIEYPISETNIVDSGDDLFLHFDTTVYDTLVFDVRVAAGVSLVLATASLAELTLDDILLEAETSGTYSISVPQSKDFVLNYLRAVNPGGDPFGLVAIDEIRAKRTTPINVFISLDSPEAAAFIRTDPILSNLSPKERLQKLKDMLEASDEYVLKFLGAGFPGTGAVPPGEAGDTPGVDVTDMSNLISGTQSQPEQPTNTSGLADPFAIMKALNISFTDAVAAANRANSKNSQSQPSQPSQPSKTETQLTQQQKSDLDKQIKYYQDLAKKDALSAQNRKDIAGLVQLGLLGAATAAAILTPLPGDEAVAGAALGSAIKQGVKQGVKPAVKPAVKPGWKVEPLNVAGRRFDMIGRELNPKTGKLLNNSHQASGQIILEKKLKSPEEVLNKIPGYYDGKPSPLGFPVEPPPKMVNGMHPDLVDGKKVADRFNRLDPESAKAMPPTGNPHIDKKVRAAAKKPK